MLGSQLCIYSHILGSFRQKGCFKLRVFLKDTQLFWLLYSPPIKVRLRQEPAEPSNLVQIHCMYYTSKLWRGLGYPPCGPFTKGDSGIVFQPVNRLLNQASQGMNSAPVGSKSQSGLPSSFILKHRKAGWLSLGRNGPKCGWRIPKWIHIPPGLPSVLKLMGNYSGAHPSGVKCPRPSSP